MRKSNENIGQKYDKNKAWKTDFNNPRRHFLLQRGGGVDVVHLSDSPNNCVVLARGAGRLLTKSHRMGGRGGEGRDKSWILGVIGAWCWETEVGQG